MAKKLNLLTRILLKKSLKDAEAALKVAQEIGDAMSIAFWVAEVNRLTQMVAHADGNPPI